MVDAKQYLLDLTNDRICGSCDVLVTLDINGGEYEEQIRLVFDSPIKRIVVTECEYAATRMAGPFNRPQ